jgi:hypothetical protein
MKLGSLVVLLASLTGSALAQEPKPTPITGEVRPEWRPAFAQLLRDLNIQNPDPVLDRAKAGQITGIYRDAILLRLEDDADCSGDVCATFIGHIEEGRFVISAMFAAGKEITMADHMVRLFGGQTLPLKFFSSRGVLQLMETPRGWMVVP